jgi:hypothetical protein
VIDEIDLPGWYWWGLALGWIGLGYINDVGAPWVSAVATRSTGRRRSPRVTIASVFIAR